MIAQYAVHSREHRFAFRRTSIFIGHFRQGSEKGVHTVADEFCDCAHRRISNHAGERVPGNALVHRLDNPSHAGSGVNNQSAETQDIGGSHERTKFPFAASIVYRAAKGKRR